jgi:hypothetical protein
LLLLLLPARALQATDLDLILLLRLLLGLVLQLGLPSVLQAPFTS